MYIEFCNLVYLRLLGSLSIRSENKLLGILNIVTFLFFVLAADEDYVRALEVN